jgi:formylglycine-generating enzyme required for sulfatase activity
MLLLRGDLLSIPNPGSNPDSASDRGKLLGAFNWAKKYYLEGKFREAEKRLELLLSYFEFETNGTQNDTDMNLESWRLLGKIYLMLGAVSEKLGKKKRAGSFYKRARTVANRLKAAGEPGIVIEELDFSDLLEGQQYAGGFNLNTFTGYIAKEMAKPKKKKVPILLIIAGTALVATVALMFMIKKKVKKQIQPDYDREALGMEWIRVEAGSYFMGSTSDMSEVDEDERPLHEVHIRTFFISKYEITFEQFEQFAAENSDIERPDDSGWGRGNRPVINVSWHDADGFCRWLSQKTGKRIDLPTEAQWEKAAGGILPLNPNRFNTTYPWGDQPHDCTLANWCCQTSTLPVGSHPNGVSFYEVHDLAGNVAEWCRDWYQTDYYAVSPFTDPTGPTGTGSNYDFLKVVRGGSWDCNGDPGIRRADRGKRRVQTGNFGSSVLRYNDIGFRIVWEPE